MPDKLLTSAQCDAFMEAHDEIAVIYNVYCDNPGWRTYRVGELTRAQEIYDTREEAVSHYCQKYHRDWQPPEIHDVQWALNYVAIHDLVVHRNPSTIITATSRWAVNKPTEPSCGGLTLTEAVESWHDKYGKPELPSPVEMLEEIESELSKSSCGTLWHCSMANVDRIRAIIAREKERKNA